MKERYIVRCEGGLRGKKIRKRKGGRASGFGGMG